MFINSHKRTPRSNDWVPLATQQLRLRSLFQVLALNAGVEDLSGKMCRPNNFLINNSTVFYYYTLHSTPLSAPFYTSEKVDSENPQWKEINWCKQSLIGIGNVNVHSEAFVVRLWMYSGLDDDELVTTWGVRLKGLIFLGQHMPCDVSLYKPNTIIFRLPGGYFTSPEKVETQYRIRHVAMVASKDDIRASYPVSSLERLQWLQRTIREKSEQVGIIKQKIISGNFVSSEARGSAMLRRLLSKNKPKGSYEDIAKFKENVAIALFRVQTLAEEKSFTISRLRSIRERIEMLSDKNQVLDSKIMEKYRLLQREINVQKEWQKKHVEKKELLLHCRAKLYYRMKQLISELSFIYPIECNEGMYTICNVHLPNSQGFVGANELGLSVALGFVAHVVERISAFLHVPLRYPIIHEGSRSRILDYISDKIPEAEREFPLFCKGRDKLHFNYAVYLLNADIAQLRLLCGFRTVDLRPTLENLSSLLTLTSLDELNNQIQSPVSSTQDLTSSTVSFQASLSSPMQYSMMRNSLSYRVSDLGENASAFGHRTTKSAGSASDFELDVPLKGCETNVTNLSSNYCYSLDKGLNELKDLKILNDGTFANEEPVPFSSLLSNSSLSRRSSLKDEARARTSSVNTWAANLHCDVISEINNSRTPVENPVEPAVSSNNLSALPYQDINSSKTTISDVQDVVNYDQTLYFEDQSVLPIQDQTKLSEEPFQSYKKEKTSNTGTLSVTSTNPFDGDSDEVENYESAEDDFKESSREINASEDHSSTSDAFLDNLADRTEPPTRQRYPSMSDPLLDNVTNRTEALTRQSSSFNTFRSRFKSTLGSTND